MAFSVPDSLVVTLERVLGNETIGMSHSLLRFPIPTNHCFNHALLYFGLDFSYFLLPGCKLRV